MFKAHDIAKKQHLERRQPTERKKFGLLEKKKDYKLRAQDYHRKQAHLRLLKAKAEQHNDDEFDYGMIRSKTKDGVRVKERETSKPLSVDAVKLLKTQDEGYIRTLELQEKRKIERAQIGLMLPNQGNHTVFVDNESEFENFDPVAHFNTVPELLHNRENRRKAEDINENNTSELDPELDEKKLENLRELQRRIARQKELSLLRQEVDLQRELMKNGSCVKKVDDEGRVSYKWLNVRKK